MQGTAFRRLATNTDEKRGLTINYINWAHSIIDLALFKPALFFAKEPTIMKPNTFLLLFVVMWVASSLTI
jgi:hypothetical protein